MPFNYQEFSAKCDKMTVDELHHEWNNYTRHMAGGATSTTLSVGFAPITMGASLIGVGLSAPRIHNARKKRAIIEAHLQAKGTTHHTRKRDVAGPMALSTAIGGLTLGLAPAGADVVVGHAAENSLHTIASNPDAIKIAAHMALDGAGTAVEHKHGKHHHQTALQKLKNSAAMKGKMVQTPLSNGNPLYSAHPGMLPPAGYPSQSSGTQQGSNAMYSPSPPPAYPSYNAGSQQAPNTVYSPPPPPAYPSYSSSANQGPHDTQFYSQVPAYPSYTTDVKQGPNDPQYYTPALGNPTYTPSIQQGPNGIPYFAPPPSNSPNATGTQQNASISQNFVPPPSSPSFAVGIQQGHNNFPYFSPPPGNSAYAADQQGARDLPSSGYPPYTASVQPGPNAEPFPPPPSGYSSSYYPPPSDGQQYGAKDIPLYSPSSAHTAYAQQWPNIPLPPPPSDYAPHSAGLPQGPNGISLLPPPPGYPSVGMPQGPHSIPVTLAPLPNATSIYQQPYQAGYLAPPAYDVHEVSDDDDPDIAEIEALLRELKASKAARASKEPTVTVTEIKA
ncbi:hypothetical protein MMC30_005297 [Trapelia coarctata]|nr:hypothetical protein [Trapelia coarctata]